MFPPVLIEICMIEHLLTEVTCQLAFSSPSSTFVQLRSIDTNVSVRDASFNCNANFRGFFGLHILMGNYVINMDYTLRSKSFIDLRLLCHLQIAN